MGLIDPKHEDQIYHLFWKSYKSPYVFLNIFVYFNFFKKFELQHIQINTSNADVN